MGVAQTADGVTLHLADGSRVYLSDAVVWRRQELYDQRDARDEIAGTDLLTLDDVTALLFAESLVGSSYVSGRRTSASSLLSGCGFYAAARKGDARAKVLRAVAGAWLDSRNEAREMYSGIGIATGENRALVDALRGAERVLVAGEASSHCVANTVRDLVAAGVPAERFVLLGGLAPDFGIHAVVACAFAGRRFAAVDFKVLHAPAHVECEVEHPLLVVALGSQFANHGDFLQAFYDFWTNHSTRVITGDCR